MTFLPIVERELRVAARSPATYRNRTFAAGAVILAALIMHGFGYFGRTPSQIGANMFYDLSFLTMLFCVVEGARKTADCLSEEKRDGTLGLLFLTDLKGYDVVLGKLVATSVSSLYGLLAILPMLALPLLIGGVTQGEFWRMVMALANILFFSLCVGMLVSSCCRREAPAMGGTLFLVLAFMLLPKFHLTHSFAWSSPALGYSQAFAARYANGAWPYWLSIAATQALAWLMLGGASVILPHSWQDAAAGKTRRPSTQRRSSADNARRTRLRTEMLAANPALWLATRDSRQGVFLWTLVAITGIGALICLLNYRSMFLLAYFGLACVINFIIKMRIASQACHFLAEARRLNSLEMLLATPLSEKEIITGQLLALRRTFLWPVVLIVLIEFAIVLVASAAEQKHNGAAETVALGIIYFTIFFLDVAAVVWAGMWFGLTAKKESQAISKTILLVLVLPLASTILWCFSPPFFIAIPIFWYARCSSRLKTEFRAIASHRYIQGQPGSGWLSIAENQSGPPVISS